LFEAVFSQAIASFFPIIRNMLEAELPFREKILLFVETYVDILMANPHIPAFVIQELNMDPSRFIDKLKDHGIKPNVLFRQIQMEIEDGKIRDMNGEHFIVNLLGMCLFPFIARPVVQAVLQKNNEQYELFLQERKKEVVQFVMHSIALL
jgi:TetR/AcrR family transcriptional regulator